MISTITSQGKAPKDNPRFVITNMKQTPQWLYEEVYCQRGEIENRIKELHAMEIDRTSCSRFWANQFRVLLTAAAYVLMQELRLSASGTNCARAPVWTLRERILKLGARVVVSVRRVVVHLLASKPKPSCCPKGISTLGDHLRTRRWDLKLLQKQVADEIGVDEATITNWERNAYHPAVRYLPAIIRFLGYDPQPPADCLPERLATARRQLGLSQRKMAEKLGVDPASIKKLGVWAASANREEFGSDRNSVSGRIAAASWAVEVSG